MSLLQEALDTYVALFRRVEHLKYDKVAHALEITKLKSRVKRLDKEKKGRMIDDLDKDDVVALMDDKEDDKKEEEAKCTVTAASIIISAAEPQVPAATITVVPVRVAAASTRRRKGVVIRDPKEESTTIIPADTKSKDKGKGIMTKEQMEDEESRGIQSINDTPAQKAAKRRKLSEEVEDLKRHLEIVPDEDDDVYTEATPLVRKNFNREDLESLWSLVKERFSTSKPNNFSDDFLLTTLGAMFEKPDGQAQVWKNQRTIHGQAKVKSWKLLESYGVHIVTFTTMWLILLVERRYPLSRFTLDQMLNAVRLRVEEESKISLELLRFTRQQHQEGQHE
uniref:Uncharacterized protein n=1 Tax=Tanacetum cinerariifolium TaxID=118510 RepID=A0A6L2L355_TANCI|nr:hypothetical protein [Tanacetum cinerariifolium]